MKKWRPIETCLFVLLMIIPFMYLVAFWSRTVTKIPLSDSVMDGMFKMAEAILVLAGVVFGMLKGESKNDKQ